MYYNLNEIFDCMPLVAILSGKEFKELNIFPETGSMLAPPYGCKLTSDVWLQLETIQRLTKPEVNRNLQV